MVIKRRKRRSPVKLELIVKSREASLAAVQLFNNPSITFKAESFAVLMVISWTYLLHAYYRSKKIDYRYFEIANVRKKFHKTKRGAYKHWELERCINCKESPLDHDTENNLRFMIGLRHEIEHQMTDRIDDAISARFQACCLNYNYYLKKLFGNEYGIDKHLAYSLQFSSIGEEQKEILLNTDLPKNIKSYIEEFDAELSNEEYRSQRFAYRIIFVEKLQNHRGQADKVIEFVKPDSHLAESLNTEYAVIKETERPKFLPKKIVEMMKKEGYSRFKVNNHTDLWKSQNARDPEPRFGVWVGKQWYWYESWVDKVREYCLENKNQFQ